MENVRTLKEPRKTHGIWRLFVLWMMVVSLFCLAYASPVGGAGEVVRLVGLSDPARVGPSDPARVGPSDPARVGPSDPAEIEAFVDDFWTGQMFPLGIPGAVFVLVKGDQILFAKGYGLADVEQGTPVDPAKTLFSIGSVSKAITASAVMQLVERGQLDLDAPVDDYLTSMQVGDRCPAPVTTAHLLTHTAGFDERVSGVFVTSPDEVMPLGEYLARDLPPCIRSPGQEMSYSNHAYALAGLVVEEVAGLPFEQYVEDNLFQPLEMRHSTFRQPLPPELDALRSTGYIFAPELQAAPLTYGNIGPSGSMWATGEDMGRYIVAHLRGGLAGGESVFAPETRTLMHQRQFSQHPRLEGWTYGFFEHLENGERLIGKNGDSFGFTSSLYLMPERDLGFFLAYNAVVPIGQAVDDPRFVFPSHFVNHYFAGDSALRPAQPSGIAARLSGRYRWSRYGHTSVDKVLSPLSLLHWRIRANPDGSILFSWPALVGEQASRFVEVEPGLFQSQDNGQYLAYNQDDRGRVTHIYTKIVEEGVLERVAWYESLAFQGAALVFVTVVFATALCAWLVDLVKRAFSVRRSHSLARSPGGRSLRLGPWLSGLLAGLGLLFLAGLASILAQGMSGGAPQVSPFMLGLLALPLVAAALALALLAYAVLAWVKHRGSMLDRIHYTVVSAAGLALVWFAWYWNLLGFKL